VIWALTDPVNPEKLIGNTEWGPVTNDKIDAYNDNALKVSSSISGKCFRDQNFMRAIFLLADPSLFKSTGVGKWKTSSCGKYRRNA